MGDALKGHKQLKGGKVECCSDRLFCGVGFPQITMMKPTRVLALSVMAFVTLLSSDVIAGHKPAPPRSESSFANMLQVLRSPDGKLRALVLFPEFPANPVDADNSKNVESRVVIQSAAGASMAVQDLSSPDGEHGYNVVAAKWSPDSQFFAFALTSSGGHSPWKFPTWIYGRKQNRIAALDNMIDGNPIVSEEFEFIGPHTLRASTWNKSGDTTAIPTSVDLEEGFENLPPEDNSYSSCLFISTHCDRHEPEPAPGALGGAPTVQTKGSTLVCPESPSLPSTPPLSPYVKGDGYYKYHDLATVWYLRFYSDGTVIMDERLDTPSFPTADTLNKTWCRGIGMFETDDHLIKFQLRIGDALVPLDFNGQAWSNELNSSDQTYTFVPWER